MSDLINIVLTITLRGGRQIMSKSLREFDDLSEMDNSIEEAIGLIPIEDVSSITYKLPGHGEFSYSEIRARQQLIWG